MTYIEFITKVETIYTPYLSDAEKVLVANFLKTNVDEVELDSLLAQVLINVDTAFKRPPSIKTLNDLLPKRTISTDAKANQAWTLVCKHSSPYVDIVFDDVAIHYGVQQMGGWHAFCNRLKTDDVWFQKRFITAYKMYLDEGLQIEHIPFRGMLDENKMVMVGDEGKCKLAFEGKGQLKIDSKIMENLGKMRLEDE